MNNLFQIERWDDFHDSYTIGYATDLEIAIKMLKDYHESCYDNKSALGAYYSNHNLYVDDFFTFEKDYNETSEEKRQQRIKDRDNENFIIVCGYVEKSHQGYETTHEEDYSISKVLINSLDGKEFYSLDNSKHKLFELIKSENRALNKENEKLHKIIEELNNK